MKPAPRTICPRRLQRVILWTVIWLYWIEGVLAGAFFCSERCFRTRVFSLDRMAWRIRSIIYHRAMQHVQRREPQLRYHQSARLWRRDHFIRALFGGRLRKLLRRRDVAIRLAIFRDVMRNLDRHVARFAKRLQHGLTRYHAFKFALVVDAIASLSAPEPSAANTS